MVVDGIFKGFFTLAFFTLENRNPSSSLFNVLFPLQLLLHNAEEKVKPSLLMSCYIFLPFLGEFSFTSCWNTKGLIFILCNPVKAIPVIHIYTCAGLFLTPGFHLWDSYQILLRWCWGNCLFALVLSSPCFQQKTHQDRELEMSCGSQTATGHSWTWSCSFELVSWSLCIQINDSHPNWGNTLV